MSRSSDTNIAETALLIGGAGFIGRHLYALLRKERPETRLMVFDHRRPDFECEYFEGDVRDPECFSELPDADLVFNLAAVHKTPGHEPSEYYETNILGALNVTRYATRAGARSIVFTSSIAVYGPSEDALHEDSPTQPKSDYGHSKLMAERIHEDWQRDALDRQLVVVRPAVVFGPGEEANFTRLSHALRQGYFVFPGRTDTIKACGYVEDLARALDFLQARHGSTHVVANFCMPQRTTIAEIVDAMRSASSEHRRPLGVVPHWCISTAARAAELLGSPFGINRARILKLVNSTNVLPTRLERDGFEFSYDIRSALRHWRERIQGPGLR